MKVKVDKENCYHFSFIKFVRKRISLTAFPHIDHASVFLSNLYSYISSNPVLTFKTPVG
ncbi:hypothetical protein J1TS3_38900 [Siminovitchia fordii]|uniref:Uncharacterized protein n=1 Tax=Siminovitchia fordii TaxID=254759 RepID=A0ABQ4KAL1_9BACI|nr:hypothetical protein J1TS3_38900 [Siminovitchia fordii]